MGKQIHHTSRNANVLPWERHGRSGDRSKGPWTWDLPHVGAAEAAHAAAVAAATPRIGTTPGLSAAARTGVPLAIPVTRAEAAPA